MVLGRYIKCWDIEMQSGATERLRKKKPCRKTLAGLAGSCVLGISKALTVISVRVDMAGTCSKMRGFWLTHLIEAALR